MDKYSKGIPTRPGLYWYRKTLESEAYLFNIDVTDDVTHIVDSDGDTIHVPAVENGFFCPAIAPDVDKQNKEG